MEGQTTPQEDQNIDQPETVEQPDQNEQQHGNAQSEVTEGEKEIKETKVPEAPVGYERRINKLTAQKYEEKAKREQAERELQELRQRLAEYDGQTEQPQKGVTDVEKRAQEIADARLRAERFNMQAERIVSSGTKEFKDFEGAVKNLHMLGALFNEDNTPTEFAETIAEFDAPHKIMHHLGSNPDEAERILSLPLRKQVRELTALELKLSQKPEKPQSKAPAPINPIGGKGAASSTEPSDSDSMEDWVRKRNAQTMRSRGK